MYSVLTLYAMKERNFINLFDSIIYVQWCILRFYCWHWQYQVHHFGWKFQIIKFGCYDYTYRSFHLDYYWKCRDLLVRDGKSSIISCEFLNTDCGPFTLGFENFRMLEAQLSLSTTKNGSNYALDNILTTESKYGKIPTTTQSPHPRRQARNFKTLKTNVNCTTAAKSNVSERRAEKVQ